MTETPILDERAVSEIAREAERLPTDYNVIERLLVRDCHERREASPWMGHTRPAADAYASVPALCQTVKHLRAEVDRGALCEECEQWEYNEDGSCRTFTVCGACWNNQQSQLEQLRAIAEGALRFRVEMNGACNHDEYMTRLCTQCEIREALEKL